MLSKKNLRMLVVCNLDKTKTHKLYWSRKPGNFVNKLTGEDFKDGDHYAFTGTVREWYETLTETVIDCGHIYKLHEDGENWNVIVSPDILTIFEASVLYHPIIEKAMLYRKRSTETTETFELLPFQELEAYNTCKGRMNNYFDVYLDKKMPRNKILCFNNDLDRFAMIQVVAMDVI